MLYQLSYFRVAAWPAPHLIDANWSQDNQSLALAGARRPRTDNCGHALGHLAFADLIDGARGAVMLEHERRRLVILPTLDRKAMSDRDTQQVGLPFAIVGQDDPRLGDGPGAVLPAEATRYQYLDQLAGREMTRDHQDRRLPRAPREHAQRADMGD